MGKLYSHLSLSERISIQSRIELGENMRQIALSLGRSASTISREVRRHEVDSYRGCFRKRRK